VRLGSVPSKQRRCAFCSRDDRKITKEHAWPAWLGTVVSLEHARVSLNLRGKRPVTWTARDDPGLSVNDVCGDCNTGWMGELEDRALPFLAPMIRDATPIRFSLEQATTLSAWALKTAMVFDLLVAAPLRRYTGEERGALRSRSIAPLTMLVWLGAYSGTTPLSATDWWGQYTTTRENGTQQQGTVSVATISAGRFACQVASFQGLDQPLLGTFRTPGLDGALMQLWPIERQRFDAGLDWPPAEILDDAKFGILQNRFEKTVTG
jgi:hypothetical protein